MAAGRGETKTQRVRAILERDLDRPEAKIRKQVGCSSALVSQVRAKMRQDREQASLTAERNDLMKEQAKRRVMDRATDAAVEGDKARDAERAKHVTLAQLWMARDFAKDMGGVEQAVYVLKQLGELKGTNGRA